ncbi:unnamed protein product, partial [marine sediment metagenome]
GSHLAKYEKELVAAVEALYSGLSSGNVPWEA